MDNDGSWTGKITEKHLISHPPTHRIIVLVLEVLKQVCFIATPGMKYRQSTFRCGFLKVALEECTDLMGRYLVPSILRR